MAFTQKTILNIIMIILLVLIRGSLQFILVYTQHGWPPITLVSFRSLLAVIVLGAIMGTRSYFSPQFWADWKASWSKRTFVLFIVMGVLNNDASIMLFAYGSPLIGASLSSILLSTTGLFVIIFSPMFLKQGQDPITRFKIIGTIVGFLGVVTIVLPKMFLSDSHHVFRLDGFCLVLGGVFAQALSQVIWKRWSILIPQNTTLGARDFMGPFSQSLFGGVLGMGLSMCTDYVNPPYDLPKHYGFFLNIFEWRNVLAILWLGIVSGVVAMLCLFYLIGSIGTAKTALCNYAFPIVGILEGALILHELDGQKPLSLGIQAGGFVIVIVGLVISNMKGKQKRVTKLRPMPSKTGEKQPLLHSEHNSVADPEIFASLAQEKM